MSPEQDLRSQRSLEGLTGTYARSLFRAVGLDSSALSRPLIGVANSWNEMLPGHFHLRSLADPLKAGIRNAGGTPLEFNTIGVCDGITQGPGMHWVLPSREVVAASVEIMAEAYQLDGLFCMASCDKIIPGMLLAAARVDIPTMFLTGGPMSVGRLGDHSLVPSDVKEAIGRLEAGTIDAEGLALIGRQFAERGHQLGDAALLAEGCDTHLLDGVERGGLVDVGEEPLFQGSEVVGHGDRFRMSSCR